MDYNIFLSHSSLTSTLTPNWTQYVYSKLDKMCIGVAVLQINVQIYTSLS